MDKTETDILTKSNDLELVTTEQELANPEFVENEQKQIVPGPLADNTDLQSNNEPEMISTQYIAEFNSVSICMDKNILLYLLIYSSYNSCRM